MSEEKAKKGRYARQKGANGERELAKIIGDEFGVEGIRRGYVFCKESDLVGIKGIHPEVKRVEKLNIEKAMQQATEESIKRKDGVPTVFHRRNHKEWLVTMKLKDWMDLYKRGISNE